MQLKYVETDKIDSEVLVECLDIKLKEKFLKFLEKGEKMAILTWQIEIIKFYFYILNRGLGNWGFGSFLNL